MSRRHITPHPHNPAPNPPVPNKGPARASGLLTPRQIKYLITLARRAYAQCQPTEPFDSWRHAQCERATGARGLSTATQRDFRALKTHFLSLAGEAVYAFTTGLAAEPELADREQAMYLLKQACERWGLDIAYPSAICLRQYRVPLAQATNQQLCQLLSTVNNRGRAKARHKAQQSQ